MSKLIPLTQGYWTIVDDEDYDNLVKHKWYARKSRSTYYACRNKTDKNGQRFTVRMHREIMKAKAGQQIDHRNTKGYDNRKTNLRFCTHIQNNANSLPRGGTSKYKGVCWKKARQKWEAQIQFNNIHYYLGRFLNEIEAALAFDVKAKELQGEFAYLNFPV